ncbi:hypothetical protein [Vibrio parahaemolyticus]|uniref:hypothetical protein n=1 Tax=Vibrio parahaemolyticus TaxID=670 RepID=UPI001934DAB2|nr:hypothetical protein [Vibrio parahaemolyticus]QQD06481.1 hypothetical protein JCT85_22885 [Vibrio parahaemolyticus]
MNQALQLNPTQVREQAIEKGIIVDYSILGKKAGFLTNVAVTPALAKAICKDNGKYTEEDYLLMFLRLCVAQTKVAFTDNKNWGVIRLYYPMPIDGFLQPTEVVIKTDSIMADVTIMLAHEEGFHLSL